MRFLVRGGAEGHLAGRNSSLVKEGNEMKPSTENVIAGKVHEGTGKTEEQSGPLTRTGYDDSE